MSEVKAGCKGCGKCACGRVAVANMAKQLIVTMPDGSEWAVPVRVVAESHAKYYAKNYEGDTDAAMKLHTAPLFDSDADAITDWAENNMNWADVKDWAKQVKEPDCVDFDDGWVNGEKSISAIP